MTTDPGTFDTNVSQKNNIPLPFFRSVRNTAETNFYAL